MSLLLHGYGDMKGKPDSWKAAVVPTLDMVEIAWSEPGAGIAKAKTFGTKPEALFIAYRTLTVPVPTGKNVCGMVADDDAWCLHHKDGRLWKTDELGYPVGSFPLLNPSHPDVIAACLVEQARLAAIGYHGVRYDEAHVGWWKYVVQFADCKEFTSRTAYVSVWASLLRKLRLAMPWVQMPSLWQFWEASATKLARAAYGFGAEDFPSGSGSLDPMTYDSAQRTTRGLSQMADLLRRQPLPLTVMFYARQGIGLADVAMMAAGFKARVYWNLDTFRQANGSLEPWVE